MLFMADDRKLSVHGWYDTLRESFVQLILKIDESFKVVQFVLFLHCV